MTAVTVDTGFINELIALAVVLFIVGLGLGFMMVRSMVGPAARTIWAARRKHMPLLLHMGRDGLWRLIVARRGFCLTPDQPVYTPTGVKYAGEVKEGDEILGGKAVGVHSFDDELYQLSTFNYGLKLKSNGDHPIYVSRRGSYGHGRSREGWSKMSDLFEEMKTTKSGARVYIQLLYPSNFGFTERSIGMSQAKLLGYLTSDGYRRGNVFTFDNIIPQFISEVKELAIKSGCGATQSTGHGTQRVYVVQASSLGALYDSLGVTTDSFGAVQTLQRAELIEFIKSQFNGGGCISSIFKPAITFSVGVSKRRAEEFRFMLWRLGVNSSIRHNMGGKLAIQGCYDVTVWEAPSLQLLLNVLEDTKYPDKFKALKLVLEERNESHKHVAHFNNDQGLWIQITKIEKTGRGKVIGWSTNPSSEIISTLGLRTHNSGLWHGSSLEVIPDEKSVHGLIGGAPLAIAHTLSAGTLNSDFLYYTNRFAAAYHQGVELDVADGKKEKKQLNPPQVADFMESLLNREAEIKNILTMIIRIQNTEVSVDEAVSGMSDDRGLAPDDYEGRAKIKDALQGAIDTRGKSYEEELKRIESAKRITVEEKGWKIDYDTVTTGGGLFGIKGPKKTLFRVKDLIHHATLNMDDFQHFMPTGSNLDDVWCLEENEIVYTPSGIKYASEIKPADKVLGGEVGDAIVPFEDDVYEVQSNSYGLKFKANGKHPIMVRSRKDRHDEKWVTINELYSLLQTKPDQYEMNPPCGRLLSAKQFKFDETRIGPEMAKLFGYLFSDGYWGQGQSACFVNSNPELLQDVRHLGERFGLRVTERITQPDQYAASSTGIAIKTPSTHLYLCEYPNNGNTRQRLTTVQRSVNDLIQELGATDKDTFGKIQELPAHELKEFVSGFFNGDGCLMFPSNDVWNKSDATRPIIVFSVGPSRRMADEFQFMLWRLGINSNISFRIDKVNGKQGLYDVKVLEREGVAKLLEFLDDRKYPSKFTRARSLAKTLKGHPHTRDEIGMWVPLKNIVKCERGKVIGWTVNPTHNIISRLGLQTKNTAIKRSEAAAIKEQSGFTTGQAMKYLVVGLVGFMFLLGMYIIITGLHI